MKVVLVTWRGPDTNVITEEFPADKFSIGTSAGWLSLYSEEQRRIVRYIPAEKVHLVQFGEKKEESPILRPTEVPFPDALLREGN